MGKKSRSVSDINIFGSYSESLETFWVKMPKFFDPEAGSGNIFDRDPGIILPWIRQPGSGTEKIRIGDKHPGSATLER
jgi:hypothetical protein